MTLLMQGYTSTANALAWALERLMRHPDAFETARSEAQTDSEEYLDAVIKETLRLRPVLPFVMRRVNKPYRLAGYDLERETMIAINLYLLHRRADLFPEPDRFRPGAVPGGQAARSTHGSRFGGGRVRNCVGASLAMTEMKVVLRTLLQRARLQPVGDRDEEIRRLGVGFTPSRGAGLGSWSVCRQRALPPRSPEPQPQLLVPLRSSAERMAAATWSGTSI